MKNPKVPYAELDTPSVLVDMAKLEANIKDMTDYAKSAGVRLRPHVKVHESAEIAKMQIKAGAVGIDTGSLGQAEAMSEAGLNDILISHPTYYGGIRLQKFKRLVSRRGIKLAVMLDMVEQAKAVSEVGVELKRKIPVVIKVDTNAPLGGFSRLGVLPGEPLLKLAKEFGKLPGIELKGVYAHEIAVNPTPETLSKYALDTGKLIVEQAEMLRKNGFNIEDVSVGASPTFRYTCRHIKEGRLKGVTEIDPGNCIIGDLVYAKSLGNVKETCAVTVLATVITTSHPEKIAIDAGYKTFGANYNIGARNDPGHIWNGMFKFGEVPGRDDLHCGRLSAETGYIYYKDPSKKELEYGERIQIIPNNATLVINIHDEIYGVRNGTVEKVFRVTARGRGN